MSELNTKPEYARSYNSWRIRILYSIIIGYACFYFCRQNFNIAMPALMEYFQVSKTQIGWILTGGSIVYGVAKLLNGFLSDRSNPRFFMVYALIVVGIITLCSAFTNSITILGILWIINNWFQSMGWPPATKMLTHWYARKELGTKWAYAASSNQLGGAFTMCVCGFLVDYFGWQAAFLVPGITAFFVAFFLYNRLRSYPKDIGLPKVEEYKECESEDFEESIKLPAKDILKTVFCNKLMWYICLANMFVYIVRSGIIFWTPLFLREFKGLSLVNAGFQVALYEALGLFGAIVSGYISDRFFDGRRGPAGCICMILLTVMLLLFWLLPARYETLSIIVLAAAGFFISGPQILIGIAAADFSSKQAVGTANGMSGLFGYLGSALAGVLIGWIIDNFGWDFVFIFFIFSSIIGAFLFSLTWNKKIRDKV